MSHSPGCAGYFDIFHRCIFYYLMLHGCNLNLNDMFLGLLLQHISNSILFLELVRSKSLNERFICILDLRSMGEFNSHSHLYLEMTSIFSLHQSKSQVYETGLSIDSIPICYIIFGSKTINDLIPERCKHRSFLFL